MCLRAGCLCSWSIQHQRSKREEHLDDRIYFRSSSKNKSIDRQCNKSIDHNYCLSRGKILFENDYFNFFRIYILNKEFWIVKRASSNAAFCVTAVRSEDELTINSTPELVIYKILILLGKSGWLRPRFFWYTFQS